MFVNKKRGARPSSDLGKNSGMPDPDYQAIKLVALLPETLQLLKEPQSFSCVESCLEASSTYNPFLFCSYKPDACYPSRTVLAILGFLKWGARL